MAKDAKLFKDLKPLGDLNAEAKQAIEQTKEQAPGAADTYFDFLKKTISSSPTGGTEFGEKLKNYAERNITATHEFIKRLTQATDFQDILRIQTEFMQAQLKEFDEKQARRGIYQGCSDECGQDAFQNIS
jgi:hypothetical protein